MIEVSHTKEIQDAYRKAHEERSQVFISMIRRLLGASQPKKTSQYATWTERTSC